MNRAFLRDLSRAAGWHRRLLASLAVAAAVYFIIVSLAPDPPPTVAVLAAAHDLPGGAVLAGSDLRTVRLPPGAVPDGAMHAGSALAGRVLAAPVRSGEALTDARFLSPGLVRRAGDGLVAYPVRIDDAEVAALLRVGDRVDVLAADSTTSSTARRVAGGVVVLALPTPARDAGGSGALLVLGATSETAQQLAQASVSSQLSVALTGSSG